MKKFMLFSFALMATGTLFSQVKLFEKRPGFSKAMETILLDFPSNYKHITGELLVTEGQFEQYASSVELPGAEYCVIGQYHSVRDTTASWQALMFRGETFEEAAKEYKSLFRSLKATQIRMIDGGVLYLNGEMEAPSEDLDFTVSTLTFGTIDHRYRDFKIELEMLYKMSEWIININIITRQKDDEVRPDWMETRR